MWPLTAILLAALLQAPDPAAEGMKALEAKDFAAAVRSFTKAAEADPNDYGARFHLALAFSLAGQPAQAAAAYRKVLELKPGLYQAELNLGIVLLQQKQAREAIPHLQSAAASKPREHRPRLYLGDALLEAGEADRAAEFYQAAAELDPKSAAAELGLGRAEARRNRLREAEPHYRKAVEMEPAYKSSLLELAALYEKNKQTTEAMALYREFPGDAGARERLGELLIESGNAAGAIPELEAAVRKSPTAANRLALSVAYRRNRQLDKAAAVLEQALDAEPGNIELRMIHGRTLRDQRNFSGAAREFLRVTEIQPGSVEAWNELAGMLVSLNQYPGALAALDRLKALGAETPGHLYLRALMLDRVKDYKGALAAYQSFLGRSNGPLPDEEFTARQRIRVIQKELSKR